ncbi:unnamed protein product [Rotaria sp. Silwood2]|nr:unnamed protein product [Rotaria sp. Silwood2]CAF2484656.1 unnamed protein product [Rotaria sp. Silwood2]CAF2716491.1 unnamed protein product [Rotaria sp. Silwood2]CAF2868335.1 unnamed protein product [Rotaria sp. Silwood2]CAF3983117.1 unnamed protein product [Rotaria sp. Silwood2]
MRNHFANVARNMNNYVAASTRNYHHGRFYSPRHDRVNYLPMYNRPSIVNSGLSGFIASGLNAVGMPRSVVNMGYRFGYFFDSYA